MLAESYETARNLLLENREVMDKLAEFLIEKETITGKEFMKIFRELKGIPEPEEETEEQKEEKPEDADNESANDKETEDKEIKETENIEATEEETAGV